MYILVYFKDNWVDKFDVEGWHIFSNQEWLNYNNKLLKIIKNYGVIKFYFGTNEGFEWNTINSLTNKFNLKNITESEALTLKRIMGNKYWGIFPVIDYYET